jgi:hypothetical protein
MPNDTVKVLIRPEFIAKFIEDRLSEALNGKDIEVELGDRDEMDGEEVKVQWRDAKRRGEVPDVSNIIEETKIYLRAAEPHE